MNTPEPTSTEGGTAGHTPTPWEIIDKREKSTFTLNWREIWSKGQPVVTAASYTHRSHGEEDEICGVRISEPDAAHIVHCVNTHAAHLARIEQLESLLRELKNALNTCRLVIQDDEARDYAGKLVEKTRAALANPERRAGG